MCFFCISMDFVLFKYFICQGVWRFISNEFIGFIWLKYMQQKANTNQRSTEKMMVVFVINRNAVMSMQVDEQKAKKKLCTCTIPFFFFVFFLNFTENGHFLFYFTLQHLDLFMSLSDHLSHVFFSFFFFIAES